MLNLKIEKLTKLYNQPLLDEVNVYHSGLGVIALVGDNGSGKSTLLKILAGIDSQDAGHIIWNGGNPSIGYMPQEIENNPTLSGGQKKLAMLAELIYSGRYDVLLLDEPDNHLDREGKEWLEQAIKDFSGLVILISHDRFFLKTVSTHVWLVENHQLRSFNYGFAKFEDVYNDEQESKAKQFETQYKEMKRLENLVEIFRIKVQHSKKLAGRYHNFEKRLSRLKAEMIEDPNKAKSHIQLRSRVDRRVIKGKMAITVRGLSFGYEDLIFDQAELYVAVGEKVALVSPNGSGKSTLIKLLLGQLQPNAGIARLGNDLKIGYYSQEHLETLDPDSTAMATFMNKYFLRDFEVELILGRFLLTKQTINSKIYTLSGGQKARLQLALFLYQNPDLLVLDEPTNHLDLKSVQALENFLSDFGGTVLLISHDRELVDRVCDLQYVVEDRKIKALVV